MHRRAAFGPVRPLAAADACSISSAGADESTQSTSLAPGPRRGEPPGAEVAEHVEHPRTAHVLAAARDGSPPGRRTSRSSGPLPIGTSKRTPFSSTTTRAVHGLADAVSTYDGRPFEFARAASRSSRSPRAARSPCSSAATISALQRLHAGRADLADDHVAVAVEHQPGQAVGFAVHEPVERLPRTAARAARAPPAAGARTATCRARSSGSRPRMRAQISACGLT